MSASTTATAVTAPARVNTRVFWERLCRAATASSERSEGFSSCS